MCGAGGEGVSGVGWGEGEGLMGHKVSLIRSR